MAADEFDDLDMDDLDDLDEEVEEQAAPAKAKAKKASGLGAAAVAAKLDVDPKTFRAWLRKAIADGVVEFDHDAKARYQWKNWRDPQLLKVIAAFKEHKAKPRTRGRKPKEEGEEGEEPTPKKKAAAKKPAAKKAARKPKAKAKR